MPKDHVDPEEAYFHKTDAEKLAKLKQEQDAEAGKAAAAALKHAHYLHCGKCGSKMDTRVFKGLEIEVCPSCGAVLLDPGELEQLVGKDEGFTVVLKDFFKFTKRRS